LQLKCDELLSNFAFKFDVRRYILDQRCVADGKIGDNQCCDRGRWLPRWGGASC
jgi:hypothetical protein